jgi:uncharacterized membrane protein
MASAQTTTTTMQGNEYSLESKRRESSVNISAAERWASLIGGTALAFFGITRDLRRGKPSIVGVTFAVLGGGCIYRGATRHSYAYQALGISTDKEHQERIEVEKVMTINLPVEGFFHFQQDFTPMRQETPAQADAERQAEQRSSVWHAWHMLKEAVVANSGNVRFHPAPGGRGTEVRVSFSYIPPVGKIGNTVSKLLGKSPEQQITVNLRHFKAMVEAGEIPTTEDQPTGRE